MLYCMESLASRKKQMQKELEQEFYLRFLAKYEPLADEYVRCDVMDNEFLVDCIYGKELGIKDPSVAKYFDAAAFFVSIGIIKAEKDILLYIDTNRLKKLKYNIENDEAEKGNSYTKKGLK